MIEAALDEVPGRWQLQLLETLVRVLKDAPIDQRAELIAPIVRIEQDRAQHFEAALAEHEARTDSIRRQHQSEILASQEQHETWRRLGLMGLAGGFCGLVVVSLFLAFLAIERHSRVLEVAMAGGAASPGSRTAASPGRTTTPTHDQIDGKRRLEVGQGV